MGLALSLATNMFEACLRFKYSRSRLRVGAVSCKLLRMLIPHSVTDQSCYALASGYSLPLPLQCASSW